MSPPLPERLGRYPVQQVIGAGAMGVVYLGFDPQIHRPVAIKTIRQHLLGQDARNLDASGRFRIEAQAAGRLNHPGIVTVYDVGEDAAAECAYIAMEYVAGHSLREYLSRGWRFTTGEVVSLVCQLLDALAEAHAKGVLHRDIKPANLLIADSGRLKVTDFGIARLESTQFTRTESVLGSPGYMAPEQYVGGDVDRRVDLFAAGVLLYRLLTGRMPYAGTDQAMMYQVVYGEPDALCRSPEDQVLAPFVPIVGQALARQPEQRFASATEFRQRLLSIAPAGWAPESLRPDRLLPPEDAPTVPPRPGATGLSVAASVPLPTGWNEATLAGIERELAQLVGPIARLLVRRTAAQTSTLEALRERVAAHIPDLQGRERFLSGGPATTLSRPTTVSPSPSPTATGGRAASTSARATDAGTRLTPADVESAASAMVATLGPIAKILARRCAAQATTREQFVASVLQQVGAGTDLAALKTRLWTAWR
jgi:serine/threonine-protein kinase